MCLKIRWKWHCGAFCSSWSDLVHWTNQTGLSHCSAPHSPCWTGWNQTRSDQWQQYRLADCWLAWCVTACRDCEKSSRQQCDLIMEPERKTLNFLNGLLNKAHSNNTAHCVKWKDTQAGDLLKGLSWAWGREWGRRWRTREEEEEEDEGLPRPSLRCGAWTTRTPWWPQRQQWWGRRSELRKFHRCSPCRDLKHRKSDVQKNPQTGRTSSLKPHCHRFLHRKEKGLNWGFPFRYLYICEHIGSRGTETHIHKHTESGLISNKETLD